MWIELSTRRPTNSRDLVDLLGECHARIRHFLALAHEAAVRRDAPIEQIDQACSYVGRYFREALPLHVADEEESIEPRLRGLSPALDESLDSMAAQHERHLSALKRLHRALATVRDVPRHEGARQELALSASALKTELEAHLLLEERVVFPAIRELLPSEAQARILEELRQRRAHGRRDGGAPPGVARE